MDPLILYKAYQKWIREPEYTPPPIETDKTKLEIDIIWLNNIIQESKNEFLQLFAYVKYNLQPKLNNARRLVDVPELGGHIELKADNYEELLSELEKHTGKISRIYTNIIDDEKILNQKVYENEQIKQQEKNQKLLNEFRLKNWTPEMCPPIKSKQLELF